MKRATQCASVLLATLLVSSLGCGAHAKPRPNDEVTVPMSEEDEAALGGESTDDELETNDSPGEDESPTE